MSVVLSVYGQNACKEFVLPAIQNAETVLIIDEKLFGLREALEICLENVDQKWSFLPSAGYEFQKKEGERTDYKLKNQANLEKEKKEFLMVINVFL